jgi:hypothetical protein
MAESLSRDTRSSLCIQLINPNTSLGMTEIMAATARQVASPGTEILAVCPDEGAPSIEGHFDEAIATLGVLQQVKGVMRASTDISLPASVTLDCLPPVSWLARRWSALLKPRCTWLRWWRPASR